MALFLGQTCCSLIFAQQVEGEEEQQEAQEETASQRPLYHNLVVDYILPDPSVIQVDNSYFYVYATEDIRNLPFHRSKDLVNWEFVGTAFTDETRPDLEKEGGI